MSSKKKNGETPEEIEIETEQLPAEDGVVLDDAEPAEKEPQQSEQEKYLRLMAEYDNFRKRSAKERESIYSDVRADTITKFLPVFDNLERALAVETADMAFKKGVEMTLLQLREVMTKLGVEEIEAVGQSFDPCFHNAVMHVEDEAHGEGEIIEEFQKGFRLGEKVIRFSMVKVAN